MRLLSTVGQILCQDLKYRRVLLNDTRARYQLQRTSAFVLLLSSVLIYFARGTRVLGASVLICVETSSLQNTGTRYLMTVAQLWSLYLLVKGLLLQWQNTCKPSHLQASAAQLPHMCMVPDSVLSEPALQRSSCLSSFCVSVVSVPISGKLSSVELNSPRPLREPCWQPRPPQCCQQILSAVLASPLCAPWCSRSAPRAERFTDTCQQTMSCNYAHWIIP